MIIQAEIDGISYLGEADANGLPHGRGTLTFVDGTVYSGTVFWGEQRGSGRWQYPDGSVMEGGFTVCRENPAFRFTSPDGISRTFFLLYFLPEVPDSSPVIEVCRRLKTFCLSHNFETEFNARAFLADAILRGADEKAMLAHISADAPLLRLPDAIRAFENSKTFT